MAVLTVAAALSYRPERAEACAGVGRRGPIRIQGEEALIVWDAERRKQHFIRTAGFAPMEEDFGFIVPTPSRPQLEEAPERVFEDLFQLYHAERPVARGGGGGRSRSRNGGGHVQVLERRTVAGLDAAVLRADQAGALDRWLRTHGYPSSDAVRRWLEPYVQRRWIVTAFRIDPRANRGRGFATRALRMSFNTDAPFFPYSEPQEPSLEEESRPFRVSVVAPSRMRVRAGNDRFRGRVGYAAAPGERLATLLRGVVPANAVSPSAWLTVFDEPQSVRGAQDLYFEADPAQTVVRPTLYDRIVPYR